MIRENLQSPQKALGNLSSWQNTLDKGVVKYSAYWCPNCLNQSELFGKQAYRELNVVECARDGINSQTKLCIDKKIKGFPTWEINGKLILGVLSLKELSKFTGFKN